MLAACKPGKKYYRSLFPVFQQDGPCQNELPRINFETSHPTTRALAVIDPMKQRPIYICRHSRHADTCPLSAIQQHRQHSGVLAGCGISGLCCVISCPWQARHGSSLSIPAQLAWGYLWSLLRGSFSLQLTLNFFAINTERQGEESTLSEGHTVQLFIIIGHTWTGAHPKCNTGRGCGNWVSLQHDGGSWWRAGSWHCSRRPKHAWLFLYYTLPRGQDRAARHLWRP